MGKTIRDWYKKFQKSGCLFTAKQTGQVMSLAETIEHVQLVSFCTKKSV
jgi:transposase